MDSWPCGNEIREKVPDRQILWWQTRPTDEDLKNVSPDAKPEPPEESQTEFLTYILLHIPPIQQPSAPADTSIQSPPPSRTIAEEDGSTPPPPPPPPNPNTVIPPLCAKRYWTRLVFAFGHQRKMLSSAPPLAITVPSGLHAKHPMRWEWKHHRLRGTMAGYFPQIGNTHRTTFCSI